MATPQTINDSISQFVRDVEVAHLIVHGTDITTVATDAGPVDSFAKAIKAFRDRTTAFIAEAGASLIRPPFLGLRTSAAILTLNSAATAGTNTFEPGTELTCSDGIYAGRTFIFQGLGTAGAFQPMLGYSAIGPLAIAGTPTLTGVDGGPFQSFLVAASGGTQPYTYAVQGGPSGMVVNAGGFVSWPSPVQGSYAGITIRATDALGAQVSLTPFTLVVAGPVPVPVNTVAPAITGLARVSYVLSISNGAWTGAVSFARQWKRNGAVIAGATAQTYMLTADDLGATITCTVTASNLGGSTPATSAATAAVISMAPPSGSIALDADALVLGTDFIVIT